MKIKNLITVITLSLSGVLPLVSLKNHENLVNRIKKTVPTSQIKNLKSKNKNRTVHKFKSVVKQGNEQLFQKLKGEYATANINVQIQNTSSYNFSIKYDTYDTYGSRQQGNQIHVHKHAPTNTIDVGVSLVQNMAVQINDIKAHWNLLSLKSPQKLNLNNIVPSSIIYSISATGSKLSPTIAFKRSYTYRSNVDKLITDNIGFFNLRNISNYLTKTAEGIFIDTIIACAILAFIFTVGGYMVALYKINVTLPQAVVEEADGVMKGLEIKPQLKEGEQLTASLRSGNVTELPGNNDNPLETKTNELTTVNTTETSFRRTKSLDNGAELKAKARKKTTVRSLSKSEIKRAARFQKAFDTISSTKSVETPEKILIPTPPKDLPELPYRQTVITQLPHGNFYYGVDNSVVGTKQGLLVIPSIPDFTDVVESTPSINSSDIVNSKVKTLEDYEKTSNKSFPKDTSMSSIPDLTDVAAADVVESTPSINSSDIANSKVKTLEDFEKTSYKTFPIYTSLSSISDLTDVSVADVDYSKLKTLDDYEKASNRTFPKNVSTRPQAEQNIFEIEKWIHNNKHAYDLTKGQLRNLIIDIGERDATMTAFFSGTDDLSRYYEGNMDLISMLIRARAEAISSNDAILETESEWDVY